MDKLTEEYEALVQFLYMAPVGLVQADLDGEIAMINPISAQLLMPLSADGGLTNLFDALQGVAPDLRHQVQAFAEPNGMVCDGVRIPVPSQQRGASEPTVLSVSLVKLDPQRVMAMLSDITQQVRREKMLRQSEAWFNAVLIGIHDYALARLDARGCIDEWNPTIGRLTGFDADAVLGKPFSVLYPGDAITTDGVADRLHDADRSGWSLDEGWRLKADGGRYWGSTMIVPLQTVHPHAHPEVASHISLVDDDTPAYCLVVRDITDKREATEQQRRTVMCDHLTGIANRRAFFDAAELELERWRRSPRPTTLLMLDADHFKRVNDTHGHPAGDAVLRHLAAVLSANFRQVDVVARIGGEEFAVLLPSTDLASACVVAERVRQAVAAQPVVVDGVSIPVTMSVGVAALDEQVNTLVALMKRADGALYEAKHAGRNQVRVGSPLTPVEQAAGPTRARATPVVG